jgi:hypothetical protein
MKDMQTVFDDLSWLYHEPAAEFAKSAADKLDTIAAEGIMVQHETAALVAVALPLAESLASIAHSLAHAIGLLEVIAEQAVQS